MRPESVLERGRVAPSVQSRSRWSLPPSVLPRVSRWLVSPPGLATLVTALFLAISVAWVLHDERVPDWDMGRHLSHVFFLREQILGGDLLSWWRLDQGTLALYPPVVHLIGVAGTLVGGVNVDAPVLALNAVGVSLLAVGCYRVASIAYDRRAGVLAVLFALGGPMVISQFHVFMVDMTQAGFVAASVWLLLETRRFSRPGMSVLAGLLVGAALLTKQSSAFFIAPLVAVMLLRGGLRDWRNAVQAQAALPLLRTPACGLLFAGVALLVALPWYLEHSGKLSHVSAASRAVGAEFPRLSFENFSWYAWNVVNHQLFLPLAVLFAIGLVHASVTWLRTRDRTDYAPELIAGVIGGSLITALWFGYHDPRYTMPALVFMAALATGWIVSLRRPIRIAATVALVSVFVVNTSAVNLGFPGPVRIPTGTAPDRVIGGHPTPEEPHLTVVNTSGHIVGPPHKGGEVLNLMRAGAEDGVEVVGYEESGIHLNPSGLGLLAQLAPIVGVNTPYAGPSPVLRHAWGGVYNPMLLGDRGMFLVHRPVDATWPEPCGRMTDGGGLYAFRGSPGEIDDAGRLVQPRFENLYCPLP